MIVEFFVYDNYLWTINESKEFSTSYWNMQSMWKEGHSKTEEGTDCNNISSDDID